MLVLALKLKLQVLRKEKMFEKKNKWVNPYGDGSTSKKILKILGV